MPVKLSDLSTETAPASNDIILIADPATGIAKKLPISALKTLLDGLGGGSDTTAPTIVSAAAVTASTIQIVFSESVVLNTAGWSFKLNGASYPISSVSGSGNTWTFTMGASAAPSDTILRSYNSTTGNTVDAASNELVTFTDQAVTNSIPANQLATPGSFTATAASKTQINLSWSDVANESSYRLEWSPNGSSSWTQIGGTISAGTTSYSHTGLTQATQYFYRLKAIGNGTTFSDSDFATANATTSSYNAEASTYFASNTGLNNTQKDAVDTFVGSLKTIGLSKFKAVYLPVWGSASANKWNLVDPADTNAAFRLTFHGTVTHGANFIKGDGSTAYANTYLNGSTALSTNNAGMSIFIKQAMVGGSNRAVMGSGTASIADAFAIFYDISSSTYCYAYSTTGGVDYTSEAIANANPIDKFISFSRRSSTMLASRINGGTEVTETTAVSGSMPNQNVFLLAINNNGTADRFAIAANSGEHEFQFFAIHQALTTGETESLRTAWNTLKSALSI
jgi:hypothetical protein